ncbi:MAG TPA: phage antirepressor N-terminal domain-containing protein [Roseiflexaceae bacterium]|nr:phage antirepressor N-terminal domain-containing protein [Roseiflexaceae bacterium]
MPPKRPSSKQSNVLFYADDIVAVQELDPNETYVPIARLCEQIGLDRAAQERRVRAHAVLAAGSRTLAVEHGNGTRPALCLRADLVPLWLASIDAANVTEEARARLELYQRECASALWQAFRPQGFGAEDELLPPRHEQSPAEQAYVAALAMATLARHQMLIERQLNARVGGDEQGPDPYAPRAALDDKDAALLAQAVRRVALAAAERTRRNEYGGVYNGLYRQFGIASYRRMPPARLHEALEWLDRWRGDLMGEPEPPPDI